jgi:hypothetical protein
MSFESVSLAELQTVEGGVDWGTVVTAAAFGAFCGAIAGSVAGPAGAVGGAIAGAVGAGAGAAYETRDE